MNGKRGPGGYPDRMREAWALRFGLRRRISETKLPASLCAQLCHCRSDEARRLILGVSERYTEGERMRLAEVCG